MLSLSNVFKHVEIEDSINNYIHFKNMHIIINPLDQNIIHSLESILNKSNQVIHIFLLDFKRINNVESIINLYPKAKIVIHIPYQVKDIKKYLDSLNIDTFKNKNVKIFVERKGPSFCMAEITKGYYKKIELVVKYEDDGVSTMISFHNTDYPNNKIVYPGGEGGAIRTFLQRDNPDLFKDEIVKNFKSSCPSGILKSFKNDDEIWDYVMQQGIWKVIGVDTVKSNNERKNKDGNNI